MEEGPGELADNERWQRGDCAVEGRAEFEKDAGEEGGARRCGANEVAWLGKPTPCGPLGWFAAALPSGVRDAGTIRFPPFCALKQGSPPQHPPHFLR